MAAPGHASPPRGESGAQPQWKLRDEDWNVPVGTPEALMSALKANQLPQTGIVALLNPPSAKALLDRHHRGQVPGGPSAIMVPTTLQQRTPTGSARVVVTRTNGRSDTKMLWMYALTEQVPQHSTQGYALPDSRKLQEYVVEVIRDSVPKEQHRDWEQQLAMTARKALEELRCKPTRMQPLRNGDGPVRKWITTTMTLLAPLEQLSGVNGLVIRPAKKSAEPVVWLDDKATLDAATAAANKHGGRVICSKRSYGIVITDKQRERAAWGALRNEPERADEATYLIRGIHRLADPDDCVALLGQHGFPCRRLAAEYTGRHWNVKVVSTAKPPDAPLSHNGSVIFIDAVSRTHRFAPASRKRRTNRRTEPTPQPKPPTPTPRAVPHAGREGGVTYADRVRGTNTRKTEPAQTPTATAPAADFVRELKALQDAQQQTTARLKDSEKWQRAQEVQAQQNLELLFALKQLQGSIDTLATRLERVEARVTTDQQGSAKPQPDTENPPRTDADATTPPRTRTTPKRQRATPKGTSPTTKDRRKKDQKEEGRPRDTSRI